jgi:hypothetical protein
MTSSEYFNLLYDNISLFIIILISIFLFYVAAYRQVVSSVFDPIFLNIVVINSICTADVLFLYFCSDIDENNLYIYILSEFGLYIGVLACGIKISAKINFHVSELQITKLNILMYVSFLFLMISSLIIFYERGAPIFLESRGDASSGGDGFGIFMRIHQNALIVFALIFFTIRQSKTTILDSILFALSVFFGLLSGYKAFFLMYFYAYFLTQGRLRNLAPSKIIAIGIIAFILTLTSFSLVYNNTDFYFLVESFMNRLVASGDVYYLSLGNNAILSLEHTNPIFQLFGGLAASLKLINWADAPENFGLKINQIVNGNSANIGPTFRYNVLFTLIFDYWELIVFFSFLIGAFIGKLASTIEHHSKINLHYLFFSFIYIKSFLLILGPDSAINDIFISILIFLMMTILSYMIESILGKRHFKY